MKGYFITATVTIPMDREEALRGFVEKAIDGYGQRLDINPRSRRVYGAGAWTKAEIVELGAQVSEMREKNPEITYATLARTFDTTPLNIKKWLKVHADAMEWEADHPGWKYNNRMAFYKKDCYIGGPLK
jgi:hypothetical protein